MIAMKHHLRLAARILLPLALAAVMSLAAAGVSSASGTATPTAAQCPTIVGYVCLAEADGGFLFIPEGQSRRYPDGLPVVELSNGTATGYCVLASPFSFSLPAWTSVSRATTVFAIGPGEICLASGQAGLSPAAGAAPQACPPIFGFVCLAETNGDLRLIPEGQAREYKDGLPVVELFNGTKSTYCVGGKPFNFGLAPGELAAQETTVLRIAPTDFACLT
jgi:hypothetical protein